MDENSLIYKIGAGALGIFTVFIIKPFWQSIKGGWEANTSNSSAQVRMIEVLQAELAGYRQREAESRELIAEVHKLRYELQEARDNIDTQSKLIKSQSEIIEKLKDEVKLLKERKGA